VQVLTVDQEGFIVDGRKSTDLTSWQRVMTSVASLTLRSAIRLGLSGIRYFSLEDKVGRAWFPCSWISHLWRQRMFLAAASPEAAADKDEAPPHNAIGAGNTIIM